MAVVVNDRDVALLATDPRLVATSIIIESNTTATFHKPLDPAPMEPPAIVLNAVWTVFSSPNIRWFYASDVNMAWAPFLSGGSELGTSRVLTAETYQQHRQELGTKVFYKCSAEQPGFSNAISPVFEITYSEDAVTTGQPGKAAYHIRLDNESRYVLYEQDGTLKDEQLPLEARAYVTKGSNDVTVDSGYITYSIETHDGVVSPSISSTGVITVQDITKDSCYVEIKATIAEPDTEVFYGLKRLKIYKQQPDASSFSISITQDHNYFEYNGETSTTNIADWSSIQLTASVVGIANAVVTWSAKTYLVNGAEIPGTQAIFTANKNICTVTDTQFLTRGGNTVAKMVLTASYTSGTVTSSSTATIVRKDGVKSTKIIVASKETLIIESNVMGAISSNSLDSQESILTIKDMGNNTLDTGGWHFSATTTSTVSLLINDTSATTGVTAVGSNPVILRISSIQTGTLTGLIVITATKAGETTLTKNIKFTVHQCSACCEILVVLPDNTIVLPVDENNNITSYSTAIRDVKVLRGAIDVTKDWILTKEDDKSITSILTPSNKLRVLKFLDSSPTEITFVKQGEHIVPNFGGDVTDFAINYNDGTICTFLYRYGIPTKAGLATSKDWGVTWQTIDITLPNNTTHSNMLNWNGYVLQFNPVKNIFIFSYSNKTNVGNDYTEVAVAYYSSDGLNWNTSTIHTSSINALDPIGSISVWVGSINIDPTSGRMYYLPSYKYVDYNVYNYQLFYTDNISSGWTMFSGPPDTAIGSTLLKQASQNWALANHGKLTLIFTKRLTPNINTLYLYTYSSGSWTQDTVTPDGILSDSTFVMGVTSAGKYGLIRYYDALWLVRDYTDGSSTWKALQPYKEGSGNARPAFGAIGTYFYNLDRLLVLKQVYTSSNRYTFTDMDLTNISKSTNCVIKGVSDISLYDMYKLINPPMEDPNFYEQKVANILGNSRAMYTIKYNTAKALFAPFDYAIVRFKWDAAGGTDLDTRTSIVNSNTQYDNIQVGWCKTGTNGEWDGAIVGPSGSTVSSGPYYLFWGGDNVEAQGPEATLIDFGAFSQDHPQLSKIEIKLEAFWYSVRNSGAMTLEFTTYLGGTMARSGFDFVNVGGTLIETTEVPIIVYPRQSSCNASTARLGNLLYDVETKQAILIPLNSDGMNPIPDNIPLNIRCYKGDIVPGATVDTAYIKIKATAKNSNYGELTAKVKVTKGKHIKDDYRMSFTPAEIVLPASSDGVVPSSAYDWVKNTSTYKITKNGEPFTTGSFTSLLYPSSGITANVVNNPLQGSGTVSVMHIADSSTEPGSVGCTVSIVDGPTLSSTLRVTKLKTGSTSGTTSSAAVTSINIIDDTLDLIMLRFNPSGTIEVKRGSGGSYSVYGNWFSPVSTTSPPGNTRYIRMAASGNGTLSLGINGAALNTWALLNSSREWYMYGKEVGVWYLTLQIGFATSNTGANATFISGRLEA